LCCNNNVDAGTVIEFGRVVESASVTELGGCFLMLGSLSRVGEMVSGRLLFLLLLCCPRYKRADSRMFFAADAERYLDLDSHLN